MNIPNDQHPQNTASNGDNEAKQDNLTKTGLDEWNARLDNNLEPEGHGDELADEQAADYSEKKGSGDTSDEPG